MDYGELLIFQRYSFEFKSSFICLKAVFNSIKDGIDSWIKFQKYMIQTRKSFLKKELFQKQKKIQKKTKKKQRDQALSLKMLLSLILQKKI